MPEQHRTDNLSAAVAAIERDRSRRWTDRYLGLMNHYGLSPSTNTPGEAHENGDVEQAHHRFKEAVDQALRARGSRDFADRAAYLNWLGELVRKRNLAGELLQGRLGLDQGVDLSQDRIQVSANDLEARIALPERCHGYHLGELLRLLPDWVSASEQAPVA